MLRHCFIFPKWVIPILCAGLFALFTFSILIEPVRREKNLAPSFPVSDKERFSDTFPTILELHLFSSNACNPLLAVDNDQIILEFMLAEPYYMENMPSVTHPSTGYLFCLRPDRRHWRFVLRIQNGWIPDQTRITAEEILRQIFSEHYRYYGSGNTITYLAPIEMNYHIFNPASQLPSSPAPSIQLPAPAYISSSSASSQAPTSALQHDPICSIVVTGNHALTFLPPEQFLTKTGNYWTISATDEGGNGPCCITVPLESPDTLLYNLTSLDACTYQIDLYQP